MKLKLTIALVILALVFGMVLAACDDGDLPEITQTTKKVNGIDVVIEKIYDMPYIPYLDKNSVLQGNNGDTTVNTPLGLDDLSY